MMAALYTAETRTPAYIRRAQSFSRIAVSFLPLALDTNRYMRIINSTVNKTVSSQRGIMASGKPIKTARELAGIPQYELAAKLGVAQSLLSNWERGEREPDERQVARALSTIRKMRDRRDVQLAEVLGEEESDR
jgi:DNA-binding transcriptional regulator YiaG